LSIITSGGEYPLGEYGREGTYSIFQILTMVFIILKNCAAAPILHVTQSWHNESYIFQNQRSVMKFVLLPYWYYWWL